MIELSVNVVRWAKFRPCLFISLLAHATCAPEEDSSKRGDDQVANVAIIATTVVISSAVIVGSVVAYRRFSKLCDYVEITAERLQQRCYRFIRATEQVSSNWYR